MKSELHARFKQAQPSWIALGTPASAAASAPPRRSRRAAWPGGALRRLGEGGNAWAGRGAGCWRGGNLEYLLCFSTARNAGDRRLRP
jgi:hypothetical protein